MIETSFTVRFLIDEPENGIEIVDEIKRLLKNSYVKFDIEDLDQEEV